MTNRAAVNSDVRNVESIWWTLRIVFGVVPVVAGLDKFTNLLVHWDKYLAPFIANVSGLRPATFMHLVGVIEIVAGLLMLFTPWTKIWAWVVALWLWAIALDLIIAGYYDIAVRDIVMGISSVCLARLTAPVAVRSRTEAIPPAAAH
jgi:uncharacterized membrane protein YphA (DoxX/SURF4 family)